MRDGQAFPQSADDWASSSMVERACEATRSPSILLTHKKPGTTAMARARHRRYDSHAATTLLGPAIRQLVAEAGLEMKNQAYRGSPVGQAVGRYLDGIKFACSPSTLESYEDVLGWLALMHDDLPDVQALADEPDLVERFLYVRWGTAAENTKAHHWKVLNLFFRWCLDTGLVTSNPMRGIRRPKNPKNARERQAYRQDIVAALIASQPDLRDRCALGLLRLAIRKNDLRMLKLGEINLALDQVFLNHAKGGKRHRLPIVFDDLFSDLGAHLAERTLEAGRDPSDEYLLYPRNRRMTPMDDSSVHRWFKRRLKIAGLPTSVQMHELRHTAADHIWRETGNLVLAQKLLRHESPATTAAYLHPTEDDLRAGLKLVEGRNEVFHSVRSGFAETRSWSQDDE